MRKPNEGSKLWPIDTLKAHPKQARLFRDLSDVELQDLAADMKRDGLRIPVEILPCGTIITGHQRVRAAKLLGWKKIEVIVCHDLAQQGDEAVEHRLISDNLVRRQLSPLARARCIQRLTELDSGTCNGRVRWNKKEALKKKIASLLHISSRSVNRYLLVLEAPECIQAAFDGNQISLIKAGKIALLSTTDKQNVSRRVASGEDLKTVVAEFLTPSKNGDDTGAAFRRLVRALGREVPQLLGKIGAISPKRVAKCGDTIKRAVALLTALSEHAGG